MKVMLDTNVCIALMRGHPEAVKHLTRFSPEDCAISSVTSYELFTGVEKAREPRRESSKVQRLVSVVRVVAFDEVAAQHAAQIRVGLEKTGQTCGPYDLLLAGHARSLGWLFATNNVREFSRVSGLLIEDWLA